MPQQEITQSVAALVLAGGSSDNPLARARAMPALEIGTCWPACGWPLHVCILLHVAWSIAALLQLAAKSDREFLQAPTSG